MERQVIHPPPLAGPSPDLECWFCGAIRPERQLAPYFAAHDAQTRRLVCEAEECREQARADIKGDAHRGRQGLPFPSFEEAVRSIRETFGIEIQAVPS